MTKSNKGNKHPSPSTSVTSERNRLMSWDSTIQGQANPGDAVPNSKSSITAKPPGFVSRIIRAIFASLAKLPYALFKLGYEIAKLVTKRLSSLRRLLFMRK